MKMTTFLLSFLLLILLCVSLLGCSKPETVSEKVSAQPAEDVSKDVPSAAKTESKYDAPVTVKGAKKDVSLTTEDGVNIAGSYYQGNDKAVILLHMMNKDRHDFDSLAKTLSGRGFTVMWIDLRGHGESDLNWMDFADADFKKMQNDVKAAADYVYSESSVGIKSMYVVGASIGANTGLNYAVTDSKVKKVVMLSPGNNYHGVSPLDALGKFANPVLIVYSKRDTAMSSSVDGMTKLDKGERKVIGYDNSKAHGTDMFVEHPELEGDIIDFINS